MLGNIVFAYIGPETILPLMSIFAAILGAMMICWRWILGFVLKGCRILFNRPIKENMTEPMEHDETDL